MNKNKLWIIGVICLCCAVLCGTLVFLYTSRQFPVVTNTVDSLLKTAENLWDKILPTQTEPTEPIPPLKIDAPLIALQYPVFSTDTHNSLSLLPFENTVSEAELHFIVSDDGYSLECEGQFSRYRPDYDGSEAPVEKWTFTADYQILTRLGIFSDAVVFLTAASELVVLDIFTGALQYTAECPVFPAGSASVNNNSYVFRGGDNNIYSYVFSPEPSVSQALVENNAVFMPEKEASEAMLLRMQNWNAGFVLPEKPQIQVLSELSAYPLAEDVVPLYVLCPETSGEYLLGITDVNLAPVTMDAVVALFTENGDLIAVSLDYVADRPQLTVNVTKSQFYYAAALPLGQKANFSAEIIPESDAETTAESEKTQAAVTDYFLTFKPLRKQD